jgi:hypothetical protein
MKRFFMDTNAFKEMSIILRMIVLNNDLTEYWKYHIINHDKKCND